MLTAYRPLIQQPETGYVDVCHAILARPDFSALNARDHTGYTALHRAAYHGHLPLDSFLIRGSHPTVTGY